MKKQKFEKTRSLEVASPCKITRTDFGDFVFYKKKKVIKDKKKKKKKKKNESTL